MVDWKQWLSFDPYKKLWFWAGRPFTYILRDIWHKVEFVWVVGLVCLGVWLGHHYEWKSILTGWLIFSAGYLAGHLFWGKDYVPGQEDKE